MLFYFIFMPKIGYFPEVFRLSPPVDTFQLKILDHPLL